jgi:hypothetical protein
MALQSIFSLPICFRFLSFYAFTFPAIQLCPISGTLRQPQFQVSVAFIICSFVQVSCDRQFVTLNKDWRVMYTGSTRRFSEIISATIHSSLALTVEGIIAFNQK